MKNIVLKDIRKIILVKLPSFPGSQVELWNGLLAGQLKELEGAKTDLERGFMTLQMLIKDWNFTDEKGNKLPVTEEAINSLPTQDITFLLQQVSEAFTEIEKKTKKNVKNSF